METSLRDAIHQTVRLMLGLVVERLEDPSGLRRAKLQVAGELIDGALREEPSASAGPEPEVETQPTPQIQVRTPNVRKGPDGKLKLITWKRAEDKRPSTRTAATKPGGPGRGRKVCARCGEVKGVKTFEKGHDACKACEGSSNGDAGHAPRLVLKVSPGEADEIVAGGDVGYLKKATLQKLARVHRDVAVLQTADGAQVATWTRRELEAAVG